MSWRDPEGDPDGDPERGQDEGVQLLYPPDFDQKHQLCHTFYSSWF
jgi:hypothetical protein